MGRMFEAGATAESSKFRLTVQGTHVHVLLSLRVDLGPVSSFGAPSCAGSIHRSVCLLISSSDSGTNPAIICNKMSLNHD